MPSLPIRMPQLGESAAEATVREWLVEVGDSVDVDQDLLEVETEKSVLTVTAPATGILLSKSVESDTLCAVGAVLGQLEVESDETVRSSAPAQDDGDHSSDGDRQFTDTAPQRQRRGQPGDDLPVPAKAAGMGYFSPRLRARMSEYSLRNDDIAGIRGTGRAGRVSVQDLEKFLETIEARATSAASPMRVAVADSMRRSWNRPLATIAMEARMDALMTHRRTLAGRPSATVYGVRALAKALSEDDHPVCRLVGDRLVHPEELNIAVAIEVEDGVLNPVLQTPHDRPFADLVSAYDAAFAAGQERRTTTVDNPAVATVSNYGTFNILWATPVPLPDQSLILGMGAVRNVPDWDPKLKGWGRKRAAEITLTFDHRVADGGHAGRLLKRIVELLERPERLE